MNIANFNSYSARQDIENVFQPIESASGMPNVSYTEDNCFRFERDHVMAKNWVAIAFESRVENAMVFPFGFMGIPILLTKSKQGQIRIFHNVCSHRGTILVDFEQKTNGRIVCPYHTWTYSLEGKLVATPNIGGAGVHSVSGFEYEGRGLKEIRSHIWMGVVFINLDGQADDFEIDMKDAISRADSLIGEAGDQLIAVSDQSNLDFDIRCNWKLVVENYLEAYHLPSIHSELNAYSPLSEHYCKIHGNKLSGQYTTIFDPKLDSDNPLPIFPGWDRENLATGDYPVAYPNLLLGFQANHVYAVIVHPITVDQSREEFGLFYCGEGATLDKFKEIRESNLSAWLAVFNEDIEPCERMQAGRQSPGYRGGSFSPVLDKCSHHFHMWMAQQYRSAGVNLT